MALHLGLCFLVARGGFLRGDRCRLRWVDVEVEEHHCGRVGIGVWSLCSRFVNFMRDWRSCGPEGGGDSPTQEKRNSG